MKNELIEIAQQYLIDNNITEPHYQCERVSLGLSLRLKEDFGIDNKIIAVEVDMSYFNGFKMDWESWDIVEHHVIQIGSKILDATASQFKGMPIVYYGSLPMIYKK